MLSETKCTKSFSDDFSKRYEVFLLELFYILYIDTCNYVKFVLLENKAFLLDIYFLEAT